MNRTGSSIARGIVCAATILCCTSVLWGVEFAGGTGVPDDPYQIATVEQLVAIGSDPNLAKGHFVLTASIDLYGTIWSSPVIPSFYGSFDGNGHTVEGLTARGTGSQGLFGRLEHTARVMNLGVVDVDLTGTIAVGGLAGYAAGAVYNCQSTGRVVSTGGDAGGLVGSNNGTIRASFSTTDVVASGRAGGLVGRNQGGTLIDCHSTATVFGPSSAGGLVGANEGSISTSHSHADVVGGSRLGALVGSNAGRISSCSSAGNVAGGDYVGGLVGRNAGRISSSYSIAAIAGRHPATTVTGSPAVLTVGGLVGANAGQGGDIVRDSYFLDPEDGGGPDNQIGKVLTAAQMMQQAGFIGWDFWGTDLDGTDDDWFMPADGFPVLAWQTEFTGLLRVPYVAGLSLEQAQAALTAAGLVPGDVKYDFSQSMPKDSVIRPAADAIVAPGETIGLVLSSGLAYDWADNPGHGTEANPYQIQSAGQLESLSAHSELWDKHFVLTADVDMAGRTYSTALIAFGTEEWITGFQGTPFTGTFDGQDHTIYSLVIQATSYQQHLGLFGTVEETARISRLHLVSASVGLPATGSPMRRSPATYVGILAGSNHGVITDCSVADSILAGFTSGDGLVGINRGSVVDCQADVVVVGSTSMTVTR
jgi:hypothetical protein